MELWTGFKGFPPQTERIVFLPSPPKIYIFKEIVEIPKTYTHKQTKFMRFETLFYEGLILFYTIIFGIMILVTTAKVL